MLAALFLFAPCAYAQTDEDALSADIEPYWETTPAPALPQTPLFSVARRFEIAIQIGYVPNDDFYNYFPAQLGLAYHFNEFWALELQASTLYLRKTTQLYDFLERNSQNPIDVEKISDEQLARFDLVAVLHPFYGKWAYDGHHIGHFNFAFYAGLGAVLTRENNAENSAERAITAHVEGEIGVAFEAFFLDWLALRIDGAINLYDGYDHFRVPCRISVGVSFYPPAI